MKRRYDSYPTYRAIFLVRIATRTLELRIFDGESLLGSAGNLDSFMIEPDLWWIPPISRVMSVGSWKTLGIVCGLGVDHIFTPRASTRSETGGSSQPASNSRNSPISSANPHWYGLLRSRSRPRAGASPVDVGCLGASTAKEISDGDVVCRELSSPDILATDGLDVRLLVRHPKTQLHRCPSSCRGSGGCLFTDGGRSPDSHTVDPVGRGTR